MTPGWRTALRLARRDAARHRGASLLALALIMLPVLAVSTAAVLWETQRIESGEAPERRLGAAEARVWIDPKAPSLVQAPDPDQATAFMADPVDNPTTLADIERVLGADRDYLPIVEREAEFATDAGWGPAGVTEVDLDSFLIEGMLRPVEGQHPPGPGEVVVNRALTERGPGIGDALEVREYGTTEATASLTVVGITESARHRDFPMAFAVPGSFGIDVERPEYLIGGAPVTWPQVMEINALGATVASRAVLADPPAAEELPLDYQFYGEDRTDALIAIAGLVIVMILIEVVLLAGPSFAVSARRQARTLALVAANGGTAKQLRRTVLASGIVLGAVAAVAGVFGGIGLAFALQPVLQRFSSSYLGPFDVPWLVLAGVAGFGVVSALLAAMVPAVLAARRDVVAVLAGRRGDGRPSVASPIIGLAVLGVGIALAVGGTRPAAGAVFGMQENLIAVAAIVCVLGMILLIPVVVAVVAKLVARAPFPIRFAGRDAARHRSRTVPAIAAVAATVAGVVALGIAAASDEAQMRGLYTQARPIGEGMITDWHGRDAEGDGLPDWDAFAAVVRERAPEVEVTAVEGMVRGEYGPELMFAESSGIWVDYRSCCGSPVLVADEMPDVVPGVSDADRAAADAMLASGGVVAFAPPEADAETANLKVQMWTEEGPPETIGRLKQAAVELIPVDPTHGMAPMQAVLSPEAAGQLGLEPGTVGLVLGDGLSKDDERTISEQLAAIDPEVNLYVERGYQASDSSVIVQLILFGLGGVLMLGGTLTATFLALSDARPDLATMAAIGARSRTRRGVAAAYALVIGFVGAVLGAFVGAIPGWAVTYPLTGDYGASMGRSHYLDIPWLLILGVVIGLPLLTAAVVGICTRSRLPMVARVE